MIKTIKDYFFLFKYVAKYTGFVWWCIADGAIWGIYRSFTTVVFVKYLFDWIEQGRPFGQIMGLVAAVGVYMLLCYVFHEVFYNYVRPLTQQNLHKRMHASLFKKAMDLDISCYDNPKFYNEYVHMLNQFEDEVMDVAFDISKFINRIFSSVVIISVVATVDVTVIIAIVFAVVVSVVLKYFRTNIVFDKQVQLMPSERKTEYVRRVFYLAEYAEEIRMSDVSEILNHQFDDAIEEQVTIHKKYAGKLLFMGLIRDLSSSVLINIGIITLLVYKIMEEGSLSLGGFTASVSATWILFYQLNNLLDYFTKLKGHSLYAEKLRNFLNYESKIVEAPEPLTVNSFESLSINNLGFRYDQKSPMVINGVNLKIQKGEKIAFVGYNGAGKSTLIKLIMRLYDPCEGEIRWNGSDIRNLKIREYRDHIGTVFQDFKIFAVSIAENVKADTVVEADRESIQEALVQSGLTNKMTKVQKGIDAEVTKEFDKHGVNFSGGETQKLAIARAIMKDSDLIILDEPSSALDLVSEYELNHTMMDAAQDKTVIFISHRLSTTIMADRIYMFEKGQVIEEGSHTELMALNGKYAEMFRVQAEKFQEEYVL